MATVERYVLPQPRQRAGVASLSERARTRYRVRYRTPERRSTDRKGFRTRREAEEFAATVEVSKMRGEFIDATASRATIGDLAPSWLARQTHLKPSAFRVVDSAWRTHVQPRWAGVRIGDVVFTQVQAWVSDLSGQRGATTTIRAYGVLAAVLDDAVRDRRLLSNPARGVELPRKLRRSHVYLDHRQVDALARAAGPQATLVRLLAYTGLRWGEATGLRVRDVNMLRRRLTVENNAVEVGSRITEGSPKSHRVRSVPFPALLTDGLALACTGKGRDALVFDDGSGGHQRRSHHGGWFAVAVAAAGVPPITPHGLRHTAASLAVSSGANVKAVQRMLGHASASMTLDVYADLFDGELDEVGAAMDRAAETALRHEEAGPSVGGMWALTPS